MARPPRHPWAANWRGLLILPALATVAAAVLSPVWPDWPVLDDLGRMLENPLPHLAALSVLLCLALIAAGARRAGAVLMAVAAIGSAMTLLGRHLPQSLPLETARPAELQVLWMNLLWRNATPPEEIAAALAAAPADLVLLAEAAPLEPYLETLKPAFPYQAGCGLGRRCEILALSRRPLAEMEMQPMPGTRPGRLVTLRLAPGNGQAGLTVIGAHLLKPWFGDMSRHDDWLVIRELSRRPGPLLLAGDFNATPWSRRMAALNRLCGLAAPRLPVATWPAAAGALGLPIDLALVRGGARLTALAPWQGVPGSDHRGLLIGVTAGDPGRPAAPVPPGCTLPQDVRRNAGL